MRSGKAVDLGTILHWSLDTEEQNRDIAALTGVLAPLRVKAGISQGALAYLVGLSRQTISMIENGKRPMSWQTYLSLLLFSIAIKLRIKCFGICPCFPKISFCVLTEIGRMRKRMAVRVAARRLIWRRFPRRWRRLCAHAPI